MRNKLLFSKANKKVHFQLYWIVARIDKPFMLQDLFSVTCNIRLTLVTPSSLEHCWCVSFLGYMLTFLPLASGKHLNSYQMCIFLKLNMEVTLFTHSFDKAHVRHTDSSSVC